MPQPKVLLVSADAEFLDFSKKLLEKEFSLTCAGSGKEAIQALAGTKGVRVVVSGLHLPDVDGIKLLDKIRTDYPTIMRIMVTGEGDFNTVAGAVHTAHVYSLLPKPCDPELLLKAVRDGAATFRKVRAESDSMRDTMFGTVRMLVDILGLIHPVAVERSKRIRRVAREICKELHAMPSQFMDMVVLLSGIGSVGLPGGLLKKLNDGESLTPEERKLFSTHPSIAARLLENIPRMGKVSEIVRHQNSPCSKKPPMGARILKVCFDFDQMKQGGATPEKTVAYMRGKPEVYDGSVMDALEHFLGESAKHECSYLTVADLEPGMVMQADMVTETGTILLQHGQTLSEASHLRIQTFSDLLHIKEPVCAVMPEAG